MQILRSISNMESWLSQDYRPTGTSLEDYGLDKDTRDLERIKSTLRIDGRVVMTDQKMSDLRKRLIHFMNSLCFQIVLCTCIITNMATLIIETDVESAQGVVPFWVITLNRCLLLLYIVELVLRLYALRLFFFHSLFNIVDLAVVVVDMGMEVFPFLVGDSVGVPLFSVFRLLRLARLTRSYKVLLQLPLLSGMVRDLVGAMEAMFWGSILLFFVLTVSSMFAVHFINPYVQELAESGTWANCDRCARAFSTVMDSNLTFVQQIIAGDSWGYLTVPIIEHKPWTAIFFILVLVTISLAVMNVILVIMVERAEEVRKDDVYSRNQARENHFVSKSKQLIKVCSQLDQNHTGDLSLDEIHRGFEENLDFRDSLKDMGIEKEDLDTVFLIMDADRSGAVDYIEFVRHIFKMKTADEQTLLNFIRHYVTLILRNQVDQSKALSEVIDGRATRTCSDRGREVRNPDQDVGPSSIGQSVVEHSVARADCPKASSSCFGMQVSDAVMTRPGASHTTASSYTTSEALIMGELHRLREDLSKWLDGDLSEALRDVTARSEASIAQLAFFVATLQGSDNYRPSLLSSSRDGTSSVAAKQPRLPQSLPQPSHWPEDDSTKEIPACS